MKETKKKCGFGKILLGIAIAAAGMIAYKKIPAVKKGVDATINAGKNMINKAGEAMTKAGKTNNQTTPKSE